ncbi:MAG TPA: EAL domain-containing protein [Acidimicrobiales bacterium]|nr:EAL domain-containing protein [Acidimicrobiales bacterium]
MSAEEQVRDLLRPGAVVPVFQPVVRLADGHVVGYEALARMPDASEQRPPNEWLAIADSVDLRVDLEMACWAAIAEAGPPPDDALLFVNTSPVTLLDRRLEALKPTLPERLVLELTEQDAVSDYELLRERLQSWSNDGVRLAIDDTGAGYSSLQHVLQLSPDFLKLDRSIISNLDRERSRRALVWSLVAFAREVGSTVIAEGVERAEELAVLRDAGVHLAQGWLLGRPGPPWPASAMSARRADALTVHPSHANDEDERFQRALSSARTPTEAAVAVCEHLHRWGELMPSVYVLRDGLLRCLAQRGYWQILDGIPQGTGLLATVVRTGQKLVCNDVAGTDFLEASPGIVAEIAVPIWVNGVVVGGLNIESLSPLTSEAEAEVERCGLLLAEWLGEIGVSAADGPMARLARSSKELAGLTEIDEVRAAVLRMACEVSGMSSGLLAERDGIGRYAVVEAVGPLADAFLDLPSDDVGRLATMVDRVSSCYTAGDVSGRPVAGTESLRAAGAIEVAVLPLASRGRRTGVIVVAHTSAMHLSTDEIEPLELLAAEAGHCLDLATTVAELRYRATRDPLTGLENHSAFHEALQGRVDRRHDPFVVAILDLDGFKHVNDTAGHLAGDRVLKEVAAAMVGALRTEDRVYRIGGDEFAAILPALDPAGALTVGERLCAAASVVLAPFGASLSVGLTVPAAGESPSTYLPRADAVLYGAKRQGGGSAIVG